jgi:hypothetical protein
MMKDRDQKQKALRFSVANRWFPQLEVDVQPGRALQEKSALVTDLDVLSSIPDEFKGFRSVVFDCKTKAKESPVNRALWLAGVLQRINADQGFCILKKEGIELDHCLMATRLNVVLLAEDEFDLYANLTCQRYASPLGNVSDMVVWEQLFDIPLRFPKLDPALRFIRSSFWMIDDSAEACRKTLACLKSMRAELDPAKPEHIALFFEFCAIFARSLAVVVCQLFKAYLLPANQADLANALLVMLYGGREAYEHRNELFKLVKAKTPDLKPPDLSLPEWERFLQLVRQCLDAPFELQRSPLILREVGFSALRGDAARVFAKALCSESPQGARFALLIPSYLGKAVMLPPEFTKIADAILLPLIPVK